MSQSKLNARSKLRSASLEALESRTMMSGTVPQVMGYLPDYQIGNSNPVFYENGSGSVSDHMDWKDLKQVNYFALLPNSDGTLQSLTSSGYSPSTQLPLLVQHATANNVQVFVTVGGGDLNKSIPAMNALVNAGQQAWTNFASQIKTFCTTYGLAGVDLDWEPVSTTAAQIQNFGTLVKTIKLADPALKLTADADGDPISVTDASSGQGYTIDNTAALYLNSVNVMAYYETPSASIGSMQDWATYLTGKNGATDVLGTTMTGKVGELQFGMEVDDTTAPALVVEAKVDDAINSGYGGLFDWTLTEDTASSSIISRIGAEVTKETAPTGGSVSGTVTAGGKGVGNITVYLDANNNSKLDLTERHTTTNTSGAYSFSNVPVGSYTVRQVLPAGDTQTSPASNGGDAVSVAAGGNLTGKNFADTLPAPAGSVSGSVRTTSGAGVVGATVYLDANNNGKLDTGELHTTISATGTYTFSQVPVHTYMVRQVAPTGDSQSSPASNAGHSISVIAGRNLTNENFVDIVPTGSVSGSVKSNTGAGIGGVTVYLDANGNRKLDTGELHATTTSTGAFSFSAVPIGAYVVREVLPAGQTQTSPSANAGHSITMTKGAKLTAENFINTAGPHKLTGTAISNSSSAGNSTLHNAFDGSLTTSFHGSTPNGIWIGLDLQTAHALTQIKFAADSADPWNMEGGVFQASNTANFSSGVVDLYTIPNTSTPSSTSLTSINVSGTYRYVRYLAPGGSSGDVAEIQVYGN